MLIVFDLDFTLWNAGGTWCDHTSAPYKMEGDIVFDGEGKAIYLYPDVRDILTRLNEAGITMAVASRTHSPETARTLLNMFGIRCFFKYEEIYPGSKLQHFELLQKESGIPYSEMYFFDDEERNVIEVGSMGVITNLVLSGLEWSNVEELEILVRKTG